MKLNGVEIPEDIDIPKLNAETIAEINEVKAGFRKDHGFGMHDSMPSSERIKISISLLRKLDPLARAKVLYAFSEQVTD
ncbi:hypothetical protein GTP45_25510 [Pseudoduganella sp. FT55W]|uniref:Uncharacterized protein n=1 Tax=Duganella rivi TaxID=2666083 RepID=A0A7X4KEC7_9BURK|nr:hypothetical protein [Duganella rivi]MYM70135.1 hypothetical protein [Duganella rivi]